MFREYFKYQDLSYMLENLNCTKNKERNKIQVNLIKRALTDLKNKIKNMSENKTEFEQPNEIVNIIEQILKILTPSQMLCRLPISLAHLNAGNNSEKLKNETRQLLYSLYR